MLVEEHFWEQDGRGVGEPLVQYDLPQPGVTLLEVKIEHIIDKIMDNFRVPLARTISHESWVGEHVQLGGPD